MNEMTRFFERAGDFLGHVHSTIPGSVADTHVVTFKYERGESSYDGAAWKYTIY